MNREDLSFLQDMFQCNVADIPYSIIIVNQSKRTVLTSDIDNIKVINDNHFGLSRSRNLAIKHATKSLCWILDDDCEVVQDAVTKIVQAHNDNLAALITFMTIAMPSGLPFSNYPSNEVQLVPKQLKKVLSPEITFKREVILNKKQLFDTRFGLGAQFPDSENYVFLTDVLSKGLNVYFKKDFIVKHDDYTSSDDVASNRVIYARGAVAARENLWTAQIKQTKYIFFLWRKGYVKGWRNLYDKYMVFNHGMNDYLTGFEGHRIGHPDL